MKIWKGILGLSFGALSLSFAAVEFKEAEITTLKNMVEHDPGNGAAPAKVSEKIQEKSKVSTAAASMAELTFADSSITRLGANTQFSFQSKERLVKLDQGTILVNTPPGKGGAVVDCGGVTGAVSGTTFMASRDAAGGVMFVMLEGSGTLKVTVPTPQGPMVKEIRPGQAASVGSATAKASSASPGGGTAPAGETDAGAAKPAPKADAIQVFDVDVKKIVETAPLIREFKNELPSIEKIEKTIETQQTAVREGKFEKLEVEVVAVKEDGDLLVGAPKVEKQEMVVVNGREARPVAGAGDNLDIETAAGPGAGGGPGADARPVAQIAPAAVAAPAPTAPVSQAGITGQIAGQTVQENPPTALEVTLNSGQGIVSLNRPTRVDRSVALSGFAGLPEEVVIRAGTSRAIFTFQPKNLFPGFVSATDPTLRTFNVSAASLTLSDVVSTGGMFPAEVLAAGNPVQNLMDVAITRIRLPAGTLVSAVEVTVGTQKPVILQAVAGETRSFVALGSWSAADVAIRTYSAGSWSNYTMGPDDVMADNAGENAVLFKALDAFFHFEARSPTAAVLPGPQQWFAELNGTRSLAAGPLESGRRGLPIDLGIAAQDFDFYAAGTFTARPEDQQDVSFGGGGGFGILVPIASHTKAILYADRVDLGVVAGAWVDLSPYDGTTDPDDTKPLEIRWSGFLGQFNEAPDSTNLVWDDLTGSLDNGFKLFSAPGQTGLTLAAGELGFRARGMDWVGNGSYGLEITSVGDVEMVASRVSNVGATPGGSSSGGLTVEAQGKVKLGGAAAADQVRLEANLATSAGTTGPQNLAVIRTGDSLELRNVVIRGFDGTRIEKITTAADGTQAMAGRVLVSGSSVRDFKIKELVGAAVNADAKIQMMAMEDNGLLAGEMMVEGSLPVATKLARELDNTITDARGNVAVQAKEIQLAADRVNLNGATLAAMNSIAIRANTVLVQNSFMTVVQNSGMINMYVQQGLVNRNFGTVVTGHANFAGDNKFQIGTRPAIVINSQGTLDAAFGTRLYDTTHNLPPQQGAINVLAL